jgi:hypothetical protein
MGAALQVGGGSGSCCAAAVVLLWIIVETALEVCCLKWPPLRALAHSPLGHMPAAAPSGDLEAVNCILVDAHKPMPAAALEPLSTQPPSEIVESLLYCTSTPMLAGNMCCVEPCLVLTVALHRGGGV